MGISKAVDEAFDVIDIMARIRQNINMAKADKITQARALERIEELLDRYEMGETLWVEALLLQRALGYSIMVLHKIGLLRGENND